MTRNCLGGLAEAIGVAADFATSFQVPAYVVEHGNAYDPEYLATIDAPEVYGVTLYTVFPGKVAR